MTPINVTVWRDGEQLELPVSLAQFQDEDLYAENVPPRMRSIAITFGARRGGVYVQSVSQRFAAYEAGFRPGQIIKSINGEVVDDELSAYAALGRANFVYGAPVEVEVIDKNGDTQTLILQAE